MSVRWLTYEIILAAHERSLRDHGGATGVRDLGMLESALGRPQNLSAYDTPSLFELAASYAYGLVKNHPFIDGNKRTSFYAAYVFLGLNGFSLEANEAEAAAIIIDLAAGEASEPDFSRWLEANSVKL